MPAFRKRLVLLGAGHAHLHVLRHAARIVRAGHEVAVVADAPFWYSGMATGMLGGQYDAADDRIDVAALAAAAGTHRVHDRAVGLDPAARAVRLATGGTLHFDVLSVALGSEVAPLPGDAENVFPAKPVHALWALRQALEAWFRTSRAAPRVLVAGAGITGCEIAANLAGLAARRAQTITVTVLSTPGGVLRGVPATPRRHVLTALLARGVQLREDGPVLRIADRTAQLRCGSQDFDFLVNATGLRAPPILREFGLPLAADGGLLVDARLRSVGDDAVHGAGDCIAFPGAPLPRAGVFAVRQAPVLLHNLRAALDGGDARRFRPRRTFLWIMNLGDGTALARFGPLYWHGRAALRLKDRIDQRFVHSQRAPAPGAELPDRAALDRE